MLGKVKSFISHFFNLGSQKQGLKRERDLSADEQPADSAPPLPQAPSSKKPKLMQSTSHERENHAQGKVKNVQQSKRELEPRDQNWGQFLKASAMQTSTPLCSPVPSDAQLLKVHQRSDVTKSNEESKFTGRKLEMNKPLTTADIGLQVGDAGSSLSQLEKLMAERLGSTAVGGKPKPKIHHSTEPSPKFTFTPFQNNTEEPIFKNEYSRTLPQPTKTFKFDLKKQAPSGNVQKTSYRPILQKLYGSPKRQKSRSLKMLLNNQTQPLTVQNCFRMEEKIFYKALLSQFVSKPSFNKITAAISSTTSSSPSSSSIFLEKLDKKEAQSIQKQLKLSEMVDLDNESSSLEKTSGASAYQSPIKPIVRINTLEDALAQSPQYDCRFISDIKSRYNAKERERERLRAEEEIRSKVLAENREGWENELEQRLRKQLEIVTRPVLDERVEEVVQLPEIVDEMQMVIDKALVGHAEGEVLCDAFNLTITRRDVKTLAGLNWLNDQVINFYLTLVMERSNSGDWPKAFAFNTFFYTKLTTSGHAGLKRWTRKVDLFQQDIILIPVHLGIHWCLATICPKEQAIRYYDSMGGRNIECLNHLRSYMEAESIDKKKTQLDTSGWKLECVENIPQQMNGSDCGMFACKYAEYLSRRAKITFNQKDMPYFRRRMVYEIITQKLIHP